jgi:hypothetical protein
MAFETNKNNNKFDQLDTEYTGIKAGLIKIGLLKNSDNFNNFIPVEHINNFFFGTHTFYEKLDKSILTQEKIIKKNIGIDNINVTKLVQYFQYINENIKLDNFAFPYNYYKIYRNDIPLFYSELMERIDNFVKYLDELGTHEGKTIRNIIMPNSKEGTFEKFGGIVVNVSSFDSSIIIKFDKLGKPLYITLGPTENPKENVLTKNGNIDKLDMVYKNICKELLMDTPDNFLITNLERVCGSREFAEIMVYSYLKKNKYIYPIDSISSIISWKSNKQRKIYINYFCSKYEHLFDSSNEQCLNFEGINKFLLNITEDDVENFECKELINEMYYKALHELIFSFELLYKNK